MKAVASSCSASFYLLSVTLGSNTVASFPSQCRLLHRILAVVKPLRAAPVWLPCGCAVATQSLPYSRRGNDNVAFSMNVEAK